MPGVKTNNLSEAKSVGEGTDASPLDFRRGHLRYFVAVAQEGQVTRAAQKLHIAQPALSQAIAQLEADVGVALFERHARGVTLTPAGEAFLVKARAVLAAWTDVILTAQSFARSSGGTIDFGFLGAPPGLDSPDALEAFSRQHPEIELRYRELPFPSRDTAAWLANVDVAVCHLPPPAPGVWTQTIRVEPRVVLARARHPLAARPELPLLEVLDETFVGFRESVDPVWAGFWSLDDHRGGPPAKVTLDGAGNPQEVIASLAVRDAITTVPRSVAPVLVNVFPELIAIPLLGAEPAQIVLSGHEDRANPLVARLASFAAGRPVAPLTPGPPVEPAAPSSRLAAGP